jgi:hypothetical protein
VNLEDDAVSVIADLPYWRGDTAVDEIYLVPASIKILLPTRNILLILDGLVPFDIGFSTSLFFSKISCS